MDVLLVRFMHLEQTSFFLKKEQSSFYYSQKLNKGSYYKCQT